MERTGYIPPEQQASPEGEPGGGDGLGARLIVGGEFLNPDQPVDPTSLQQELRAIADGTRPVDINPLDHFAAKQRAVLQKDRTFDQQYKMWSDDFHHWILATDMLRDSTRPQDQQRYTDRVEALNAFGINITAFSSSFAAERQQTIKSYYDNFGKKTKLAAFTEAVLTSAREQNTEVSIPLLERRLKAIDRLLYYCGGNDVKEAVYSHILTQGSLRAAPRERNTFIQTTASTPNAMNAQQKRILSGVYSAYCELHPEPPEPGDPEPKKDDKPDGVHSSDHSDAHQVYPDNRNGTNHTSQRTPSPKPAQQEPIPMPAHVGPTASTEEEAMAELQESIARQKREDAAKKKLRDEEEEERNKQVTTNDDDSVPVLPTEEPDQTNETPDASPSATDDLEQKSGDIFAKNLLSDKEKIDIRPEEEMTEIQITIDVATKEKNPGTAIPNEDAYFASPEHKAAGVFDGMGGLATGEVASETARITVEAQIAAIPDDMPVAEARERMRAILLSAHEAILQKATEDPKYEKMGTTASVVKILKDGTAVIGNIGDSRVYLLRENAQMVEQCTLDDGRIRHENPDEQEAWDIQSKAGRLSYSGDNEPERVYINQHHLSPLNTPLYQYLGDHDAIQPHIYTVKIAPGDRLLLTSDGIHDNLPDGVITQCLLDAPTNDDAANAMLEEIIKQLPLKGKQDEDENYLNIRAKTDDLTVVIISRTT